MPNSGMETRMITDRHRHRLRVRLGGFTRTFRLPGTQLVHDLLHGG